MVTKTIAAGEFKARCLALMDEVRATGQTIIIAKRGVPVAKLVPVEPAAPNLFGLAAETAELVGELVPPLEIDRGWPTALPWLADEGKHGKKGKKKKKHK